MREKRKELEKDKKRALNILKKGNQKAKKIAEEKMKEVRRKIGVSL